ncbi:MAG TPA: serine hydrolase domain-containing protein [Luteitalea sp.]|nr:serine hydrolase domain-containing protein [Luteitalea sp.]
MLSRPALMLVLLLTTAACSRPVGSPPGLATVVTRGDTLVRLDAEGYDSTGAPITADTPMRVASITKSFTAAAVLTLVDEGRVGLDQPLVTYVSDFRMADERASAITVRHLLNQTSGLADYTVDIRATQRAADLATLVATLRSGTLAAAPGTRYAYCNVNYELAARLVEVVDGRPFAEAMRARVFNPLGMKDSAIGTTPADGYISLFGWWVARHELPGFRGGAGGAVTTARDMGRWLIAQAGHGSLLSPASLRELHTPGAVARGYAMGWGPIDIAGRTLLVHSGNLFTYTAVQAIDQQTGEGWAVMTNSAALGDPTFETLLALVGRTEVSHSERPLVEAGLAATAIVSVLLAAIGVRRPRRPRRLWRLLPPLVPLAVLATTPQWISMLTHGRTVTWPQMTYFPAPLTITLAVVALAGVLTFVARLRWALSSRNHMRRATR